MTDSDQDAVWIKSEPDEDGNYHLYLELGEDDVTPLNVDDAYGWARSVLSAVAAAEYDAAVFKQLQAVGVPVEGAAEVVKIMRDDRAEHVPLSPVPGLTLIPGVSAFTRKGFLQLQRHGKPVGQWEMDDAREHAITIITALEVTVLDSAYLRALQRNIGIDQGRALQIVDDLANYRDR